MGYSFFLHLAEVVRVDYEGTFLESEKVVQPNLRCVWLIMLDKLSHFIKVSFVSGVVSVVFIRAGLQRF